MQNFTNFDDFQQYYTASGQNTYDAHVDFLSLPKPDAFQDLNSFGTDSHPMTSNLTWELSSSEQSVGQHEYNLHVDQYPLNTTSSDQGHVNYVPADNNELFSSLDNTKDDCVGEHFPFRKNPVHNMDTEIIATATPFESGKSAGDKPQLRCLVPECLQDSEFPSESALRKHEAKHSKPYICQVSNCRHTRFGNKGGLDRHSREVHGSQTYCCPVTSCKRHVRGFPRKFNLYEHQKRCHSSQSLNLLPPSILGQQVQTSGSMNERNLSYEGGLSPEMVVGDSERLREKLEKLHKKRMEIDVDIDAVKRSLDLLGEDSL